MSMGESHEHGRTTCAYKGVNGVTFRVIAQSSAVSLLRQICKSLRFVIMSAGGRHDNMSTPCSYDEVNALISASSMSLLREFDI
jgi:hypothetical protein